MKPILKIGVCLVGGVLLTGAIISIAANQNNVNQLRAQNDELLKASDEMARLKAENGGLEQLRAENEEVQKLRVANKDLPKLRNEVQQLRSQIQEAEKLRAENERLKSASTIIGSGQAFISNKFPKESLREVGFAAPRATLETYYAAMSQGNIARAKECFTQSALSHRHIESDDDFRQQTPLPIDGFTGYEILGREQKNPDEIVLSIRLTSLQTVQTIWFKQVGNEWKME